MNTTNNFKSFVPVELQTKIHGLVELSKDLVNSVGEVVVSCDDVEEIQGNHVSGWIPRQDGGFSASAYISNGDGYHVCESHKDSIDSMYFECLAQFCCENDIEYTRHTNVDGCVIVDDPNFWESVENREKFYEYEREWNSDGNASLVTFDCFVDGANKYGWNGEGDVTIRLSVNFKDAPYYREKYATDLYTSILTIDEFMTMDNSDIIKAVIINEKA